MLRHDLCKNTSYCLLLTKVPNCSGARETKIRRKFSVYKCFVNFPWQNAAQIEKVIDIVMRFKLANLLKSVGSLLFIGSIFRFGQVKG